MFSDFSPSKEGKTLRNVLRMHVVENDGVADFCRHLEAILERLACSCKVCQHIFITRLHARNSVGTLRMMRRCNGLCWRTSRASAMLAHRGLDAYLRWPRCDAGPWAPCRTGTPTHVKCEPASLKLPESTLHQRMAAPAGLCHCAILCLFSCSDRSKRNAQVLAVCMYLFVGRP
jgi:hypothetical protein